MDTERKILSLIILLLISGLVQAQSSAQATMEVSVRIVSGLTTTSTTSQVSYSDGHFNGAFGALNVQGSDQAQMLVTTEKELDLVNSSGHKISITVKKNGAQNRADRQYEFAIDNDGQSGDPPGHGVYRGSLQTTIEYM